MVLNGCFSKLVDMLAGVPQGSILGPLLFLIFINDAVTGLISIPFLFADDTSLMSIGGSWTEVERALKMDLKTLDSWSKTWRLTFNLEKSEYIMFCDRKSTQMDIVLGGVTLSSVATHKHLGIVYNRELNWSDHIDQVVKKVSKKLDLFRDAGTKKRQGGQKISKRHCVIILN